MRNFLRKAIPFIVLGLFVVFAAILPNLLSEDILNWCKTSLGPYWWAVVILFFFMLFALAVKYKPDLLGDLIPNNKDNPNPKPEDISHFYPKIREYLKSRYQSRLDQKLAWRQPVNLRRLPSFIGSDDAISTYVPYSPGEIQEEMAQTFREAKGRLLLIGAPGAGKTSLLLQLVLDLLKTEKEALPAIINLATWTSEFLDLNSWLLEILPAELGLNKILATQILLDNRLLLLFDGLDEVKEENRKSCLEAIGKYGMDGKRHFVITCRMEEYKMLEKDAPVNLQIEVGPLTIEQVEKSLAGMGHVQPEALPLYFALQHDKLLKEAVLTPFYLNTLQLMFASGKTWGDFHFVAETMKDRQLEVVELFAVAALQQPSYQAKSSKDDRHWLGFWASRLKQTGLVVFELRDLQYDCWNWGRWQKVGAGVIKWLIIGLVIGLLIGLLDKALDGLLGKSLDGLLFKGLAGMLIGVLVGLVVDLIVKLPIIETKDEPNWSIDKYFQIIREDLKVILFVSVFFGLFIALVIKLPYGGMLLGTIVGLLVGLLGGLLKMIQNSHLSFLQITTPYQRFTASLKSLHFSILQHLHLRWLLYRKGLLPLHLVEFLNEMTERHILESDGAIFDNNGKIIKSGATWRFRHRILQEYFAKQWVEPEAENKQGT